ncbi:MAG: hypothetical protein K9G46_15915, partial [Flavobacteriales bacterium]|nr:hypothetical protein [Flavobacteriales bacterium]
MMNSTINLLCVWFSLWMLDARGQQATLVADIWPGIESSSPTSLNVLNDKLFFWATNGTSG